MMTPNQRANHQMNMVGCPAYSVQQQMQSDMPSQSGGSYNAGRDSVRHMDEAVYIPKHDPYTMGVELNKIGNEIGNQELHHVAEAIARQQSPMLNNPEIMFRDEATRHMDFVNNAPNSGMSEAETRSLLKFIGDVSAR